MSLDNLLIVIIIAGIGLAGAYLKSEYALHMRSKAAELRKELDLRDLLVARVRLEQNGIHVQVRLDHAPMQPQIDRTIRFLVSHSRSARSAA